MLMLLSVGFMEEKNEGAHDVFFAHGPSRKRFKF